MGAGNLNEKEPAPELWRDDQFATADEGQPLAILIGEGFLAPVWVSAIYGLRAEAAPQTSQKK